MAETITLRTAVDVFVSPTEPARFGMQRLYVNATAQAYLYFNMPLMPPNAQILSATLRMYAGGDLAALTSGFPTINIHTVTSAYDANTLTWLTKPTESGVVETLSVPTNNTTELWQFDVTPELQAGMSSGVWYGFTVKGNGGPTHFFWSSMSAYPMTLEIQWTAPPALPTMLQPSDGVRVNKTKPVLTWNTQSSGGNERPYSFNVQVATAANMVTGLWDSGEVLSTSNLLDTNTTAMPAITSGQTRYWRVRSKNTSGVWSAWSAVSSFVYTAPGVLTLTGPAASMGDPDPLVTWTFTGATQQAYQVYIMDAVGKWVHDSGIKYGTALSYQLPQGIWKYNGDAYWVVIHVWDTQDRVSSATSPSWLEAARVVTFAPGGTAPPVQILVSDYAVGYPHQEVRWQYTGTLPTKFMVYRYRYPGDVNPVTYFFTPAQVAAPAIGPNWYWMQDLFVTGRTATTWQVRAELNGVISNTEPTVTKTVMNLMPWLVSTTDINKRVALVNANIDPGLTEVSDIVSPVAGAPFLVTQSLKGYVGSASGVMANGTVNGLTARQMKEYFLWMRENPRCYFMWADEAVECYIFDTKLVPVPTADGNTDYSISFGFIEIRKGS